MNKATRIIIISLIAIFIGGIIFVKLPKNNTETTGTSLDPYTIYAGGDANGGIADHIKGGEKAKVILYEYADYQCPGCAAVNPWINELLNEYEGKVGLVYRSYLLSYHANARSAAAAAEAAGLQGYWKEYANILFANQSEWEYATTSDRNNYFTTYLDSVSNGKADKDKFLSDMASESVSKKIDFDVSLAKAVKIEATPALYIDGQAIDWYDNSTKTDFLNFFRDLLDKKLEEASK